jgi:hypothetical protein
MMPAFPSPPLKFRTVGFPQYGFKASLSGHTFPHRRPVKCAPHIPEPRSGLCRPSPASAPTRRCGSESTSGRASTSRCARGTPLYPRGPWLRFGLCCPEPSSLTTTPSASLAGTRRLHGPAAYTPRLRCAGAPGRPARPSLLSLPCFPHVPSTVRRWVRGAFPLCSRPAARFPRPITESPPTRPVSASNP